MLVETLTQVHAIGYEGVSIDRFLRRLQENEIKMIIDVRANPISRKPGFSKTALKARLKQIDVKYEHFPQLGIPSYIRKQYDDIYELLDYYEEEILTLPSTFELARKVADICHMYNSALLCFEEDPKQCHRSRLAKYIADNFGLEPDFISYDW